MLILTSNLFLIAFELCSSAGLACSSFMSVRYNRAMFISVLLSYAFFIPFLTVYTVLSTKPFDCTYIGEEVTYSKVPKFNEQLESTIVILWVTVTDHAFITPCSPNMDFRAPTTSWLAYRLGILRTKGNFLSLSCTSTTFVGSFKVWISSAIFEIGCITFSSYTAPTFFYRPCFSAVENGVSLFCKKMCKFLLYSLWFSFEHNDIVCNSYGAGAIFQYLVYF